MSCMADARLASWIRYGQHLRCGPPFTSQGGLFGQHLAQDPDAQDLDQLGIGEAHSGVFHRMSWMRTGSCNDPDVCGAAYLSSGECGQLGGIAVTHHLDPGLFRLDLLQLRGRQHDVGRRDVFKVGWKQS